ncbi:Zinc-type alcohol dehydrogenase-like protein [Penicillium rolfsii]|nr:Zinc-type alcohol dehydrogenase-like protein [Penicillium rolfsii]
MSFPLSYKAAVVHEPKARHVVITRTLEAPESGEISIKITATAINPVDWKMRDYDAFVTEYPAILGSDAAGVVVAVGPDVSNFEIGDRVFFQGMIGKYTSSTFQQYCKMPEELVSKTPGNITDEQAAGVSLATMAVVTAFYSKEGHDLTPPWEKGGAQAGAGASIIIIGGASSVGQYAIQLARLSGFERVITNASAPNHSFLHELGAHVVLDRSLADARAFAEEVGGDLPLAFVFDAISSKATQILAVEILQNTRSTSNHLVTVHVVRPESIDADALALAKSNEPEVTIKQVLGIGSFPELRHLSEPMARELGGESGYLARGLLRPNRPLVISGGLNAVEEALALNKSGVSGQKVIICP